MDDENDFTTIEARLDARGKPDLNLEGEREEGWPPPQVIVRVARTTSNTEAVKLLERITKMYREMPEVVPPTSEQLRAVDDLMKDLGAVDAYAKLSDDDASVVLLTPNQLPPELADRFRELEPILRLVLIYLDDKEAGEGGIDNGKDQG